MKRDDQPYSAVEDFRFNIIYIFRISLLCNVVLSNVLKEDRKAVHSVCSVEDVFYKTKEVAVGQDNTTQ